MVWERRWNPLQEDWVTITGHRNSRPWSLPQKRILRSSQRHDPSCALCPGNQRISGERNPDYQSIFIFDNDHPAFALPAPSNRVIENSPFVSAPAGGLCRVVCYSPAHNKTLADLSIDETKRLIDVWAQQTSELMSMEKIEQVLIFENSGELVGVSNTHPHGQIYATQFVMEGIKKEARAFENSPSPLMENLLEAELSDGRRMLYEGADVLAFVPYFAKFPYEVFIVPRNQHQFLSGLSAAERQDLAAALNQILRRYAAMWNCPFPYMLLVHQAPCDISHPSFHTHIQIHPILRGPNLPKYLASVETGANHFLNDGSPEEKAAELREVDIVSTWQKTC